MKSQRVQVIASRTTTTVPPEFVRADTEQPSRTTLKGPVPEIPVIDLSGPNEVVVGQIFDASSKLGMFQVVNHGIPNEVINKLRNVGKEFFELPQEEKEMIAKPIEAKNVEGYGTYLQKEVEGKKGWVDHLFHRIWPPSAIDFNFWPKNPPSYREANEEYAKYLHEVVDKLLMALSLGLGLEGGDLKKSVGGDELIYMLKVNYYPKCPQPDLVLGVVAHTDISAITILVPNDVQGLQVFDGQYWFDVKYIPNALIIHIGDQTEILSNGKYKSVLHRSIVNKDNARMSWPLFLQPPKELMVGPHPKLINQENPPKFKTKAYGDYAYCKLNKLPQ